MESDRTPGIGIGFHIALCHVDFDRSPESFPLYLKSTAPPAVGAAIRRFSPVQWQGDSRGAKEAQKQGQIQ